jgi:hypothetical protein
MQRVQLPRTAGGFCFGHHLQTWNQLRLAIALTCCTAVLSNIVPFSRGGCRKDLVDQTASCFLLLAFSATHCCCRAVDKLFGQMTPMVTEGSRDSPCARAVPNLTDCATDGSLQVKEGCCSAACAGKMQQVRLLQQGTS